MNNDEPDIIVDFHGYTSLEARYALQEIIFDDDYAYIRIITGKGSHQGEGMSGVVKNTVHAFLREHNISFQDAPPHEGGSGACDIFL